MSKKGGNTYNSSESLKSVIYARLPKRTFVTLPRSHLGVIEDVSFFNHGYVIKWWLCWTIWNCIQGSNLRKQWDDWIKQEFIKQKKRRKNERTRKFERTEWKGNWSTYVQLKRAQISLHSLLEDASKHTLNWPTMDARPISWWKKCYYSLLYTSPRSITPKNGGKRPDGCSFYFNRLK